MKHRWLLAVIGAAVVCCSGWAAAQEPDASEEDLTTREAAERTLATADQPAPPTFIVWQSEDGDSFLKPVLQIATLLTVYMPYREVNEELADRVSTLMLSRFGLEGQLFEFLTFRSVFERNIGFTLSRNGPVGTSVWEGSASLQALESYIRLARWGLSIAGGIVPDPAAVDFVSPNILDAFGKDPYVREPMLATGGNQGQGFLLNYTWRDLTAGFAYTGGNPLVSSLSYPFGGDVSTLGTLYTAPLRALSNGVPGSDVHMNVIGPSLMYLSHFFDIKVAYQHYFVDVNVISEDDQDLTGWNVRGTFQVKLLDDMLRIMGTASYRENEQLNVPDLTTRREDDFKGMVFAGGFDVDLGQFGIGGNYYWIRDEIDPDREFTTQYINVGFSYWLWEPFAAVGARYARSMDETTAEGVAVPFDHTQSFLVSMRLLI